MLPVVSLQHAVLASLLDGEATGYELAKRMDVSVANFWHATPQQIYGELRRLEAEGLASVTEVPQARRPTKRVFTLTELGRAELARFTAKSPRPTAIKDELFVQMQAVDAGDVAAVIAALEDRRSAGAQRLAVLEALIRDFLRDRDEETFLRTARRVGPYLNLRRGRDFEAENLAWYEWAADVLRARAARR
jgi:DNA-binding PadR family transcriptional regulator